MSSIGLEPYEALGNAVVLLAAKDYRDAVKKLSRGRKNVAAEDTKRGVREIFHVRLFQHIYIT